MRARFVFLFGLALGCAACGSSSRAASAPDTVGTITGHDVRITIEDSLSFGRDEARARARKALETDLHRLRDEEPEAYAWAAPKLRRVECRSDGGVRGKHAAELDADGSTVVVVRDHRPGRLPLVEGDVFAAVRSAFYDELDRRFRTIQPEQVPPSERRLYFVYLRGARFRGSDVPPWVGVDRMARLASVVGASDGELAADIRRWLFERTKDMVEVHKAPPNLAADLAFVRPAFVRWLSSVLPSASAKEKLDFAHVLFVPFTSYGYGTANTEDPLPGFDIFAFGLAIADEWRAMGHPTTVPPGDVRGQLFDFVLAPPRVDEAGKLVRSSSDPSPWIEHVAADPRRTQLLFDAVTLRKDPVFTRFVSYSYPRARSAPKTTDFLHLLERSPEAWRMAVLSLIAQQRSAACEALEPAANHAWGEVPALRGTALHVLACRHERKRKTSDEHFLQFAKLYGTAVDGKVFGDFLDDGVDAMKLADVIWPALAKGFSRVAVVAPRLEAFLADERVRAPDSGEPVDTLRALTRRLCEDGNTAEVARFHQTLKKLAASKAEHARALATSIEESAPGRCAKKK